MGFRLFDGDFLSMVEVRELENVPDSYIRAIYTRHRKQHSEVQNYSHLTIVLFGQFLPSVSRLLQSRVLFLSYTIYSTSSYFGDFRNKYYACLVPEST